MSEAIQAAPEAAISQEPVIEQNREQITPDQAAQQAPKVEQPKSSKRTFEIKTNGKVQKIDFDPNDEKLVKGYLEKALASEEKFQEAASMRKQMEAFVQELQKNPLAILKNKHLGLNLRELAEQVLLEELEEETKSPEQKEQEKLKLELENERKERTRLEEEKRKIEMERHQEQHFQEFDNQITEALKNFNVPKSPYVVKRIADTMIEALNLQDEKGNQLYPNVTIEQIMPLVEEQIQSEIQQMFEIMPTEVLEKLVGKTHLNKMRKARVAQAKTQAATLNQIKDTGASVKLPEKEEPKKSIRMKDLFGRF